MPISLQMQQEMIRLIFKLNLNLTYLFFLNLIYIKFIKFI